MGPLLVAMTATVAPHVVVLPAITMERGTAGHPVSEETRAAFDDAFRDAVEGTYLARGWIVIDRDETVRAMGPSPCSTAACARALAASAGAQRWVGAVILQRESGCMAYSMEGDAISVRVPRRLETRISPCTPELLLVSAEDLGRRIADGPRRDPSVSLALTPLSVPYLNIADLPALVATATLARPPDELDEALSLYRENRFALATNDEGLVIAVRGRTPISDCDLFPIAGVRPTAAQSDVCAGNAWELAMIAAPLGALFLVPGVINVGEGDSPAVLIGALVVVAGSIGLAFWLDEDPPDAGRGEHVVEIDALEDLVDRSNLTLQRKLELSDAELRVHGL